MNNDYSIIETRKYYTGYNDSCLTASLYPFLPSCDRTTEDTAYETHDTETGQGLVAGLVAESDESLKQVC